MSDSQAGALMAAAAVTPEVVSPLTPAAVEDGYYDILAGGARYSLFLSLVDFNVLPLMSHGPMAAVDIIATLGLDPLRGRKWLHLLALTGLFVSYEDPSAGLSYYPSEMVLRMFGADGTGGWFHREFLRYYRAASYYGMQSLLWTLRGAPIEYEVRYPPQAQADVELLHEWMRNTALTTLSTIERYFDFSRVARLLDVAGGDGTMALQLWGRHAHLNITIFNVPAAAEMAKRRIEEAGASERIQVVAGDFREVESFPEAAGGGKHDVVMFSRVLADWPPELCTKLLAKAHAVLEDGGKLIICEPLADENPSLAIAWEQSYLPYDDFGLAVYKPYSAYETMLAENGFRILQVHRRDYTTIHCVIIAEKA
jgi:ubiquinone/menaquinone biosynthesis C-methylase UbiE